jgi:baseplate J-like protein
MAIMTCIILRPDPQTLFDQITNQFSSTVLGGGKVIPESNEWYVIANDYATAEMFYAIADQMWREANPETACCDNLYVLGARRGVFPKPATNAQGYAKLTGTPGSPVPSSLEISTSIGVFVSVGTVPLSIPSTGYVTVRIQALTPGPEMNSDGSVTTGTMTTPAPGIDADVAICGGQFCGGADAETCDQFRKRFLDRLSYQPRATQAWIKQKLLEFPCATRVCVREGTCCKCGGNGCAECGTRLEFYVMFDGVFPCGIPPLNVINDITTWMFGANQGYGEGQVEIGVCGSIYQPIPIWLDVLIDIAACPSQSQKQQISDLVQQLFLRLCPSLPLRVKQIELIVANILGTDVNSSASFSLIGTYDTTQVFITACGDLEPECDYIPCLRNIVFPQDLRTPIC